MHSVHRAGHALHQLHDVFESAHRIDEAAIGEHLIEQQNVDGRVALVDFDNRVVDARMTRRRKIIAAAHDCNHIADHFGIPDDRADETHLCFDRDRRFSSKECSNVAALAFERCITAAITVLSTIARASGLNK